MKLTLLITTDEAGLATMEKLQESFRPWDSQVPIVDCVQVTWTKVVQSTSVAIANSVISNEAVKNILIARDE